MDTEEGESLALQLKGAVGGSSGSSRLDDVHAVLTRSQPCNTSCTTSLIKCLLSCPSRVSSFCCFLIQTSFPRSCLRVSLSLVSKPRTAGKSRNRLLTLNLESDSKQRERGTTDDMHTCLCTSLFSPRPIDKTVAINTRLCPYMARHFYSALSDRRSPFVFLQLTNFSSPHQLTINFFVVLVAPFSLTEIRKRPSGLFL